MTSQPSTQPLKIIAGVFGEQSAAESARQTLQSEGFPADRVSTEVQAIDPNPKLQDSRGKDSAKSGAIVGSLFGGICSFLLIFSGAAVTSGSPLSGDPTTPTIAVILLGLAVGAAAGALLGGLSGVNAPKSSSQGDRDRLRRSYLVKVECTDAELERAAEILRQHGSDVAI